MPRMRAIRLAVKAALPEDMRLTDFSLDAKGVNDLLVAVAQQHPERYGEVAKAMHDAGRRHAYLEGVSVGLDDLKPAFDASALYADMDAKIEQARASLPASAFPAAREAIWLQASNELERQTADSSAAAGNPLSDMVRSGARGKRDNLKALLASPALFADAHGQTVPKFVRRSYGQGLRPADWLAATFGARTSVISTKTSTAKGGALAKMMDQALSRLVVTEQDCGTTNGVPLQTSDKDIRGRVLARPAGSMPVNTVLDRAAAGQLRKALPSGTVLVRSPLTCRARHGVCAKCAGLNPSGKFPKIGDAIGTTSGHAIGEPVTQGALSHKHTGGMTGARREHAGFEWINQFVQSPEEFEDKAPVAEQEGVVSEIRDLPQGGKEIHIGKHRYYAGPSVELLVKPGQSVEPGEQLAGGLVDPHDIVRLRGLGEGRKYYVDRLSRMLRDSGMPPWRRNVEMLARGALDHVRLTDFTNDDDDDSAWGLPGDVVSYTSIARNYIPPKTARMVPVDKAGGMFLQQEIMHHTLGTKLLPSMVKGLRDSGVESVLVDDKPPPFEPEMTRLQAAGHYQPDWLAAQHTSYLGRQMAQHAMRGSDTNVLHNEHFAPRLAVGVDFGKHLGESGQY